jgi:hypothetical protein
MTKPRNYAKFDGVMMGHEEKSENTIFLPASGAVKGEDRFRSGD